MSTVVTLVSSRKDLPLSDKIIDHVIAVLARHDVMPICAPVWLQPNKAVDIGVDVDGAPPRALVDELQHTLSNHLIDIFIVGIENRRKKLLIADMDSTIVHGETLDDLAEYAGIKDRIAEITERAMNGELDFHAAIAERVKLLKGLSTDAIKQTLQKLQLNPGAKTFIGTMRKFNCQCILVSGGFTVFTGAVAKSLEFNNHHGNILEVEHDALTGTVRHPILDKNAKVHFLKDYTTKLNLKPHHTLAIGDGANDLPMLQTAGLGLGYKPKETVRKGVVNSIIYGDLSTALYAQGINGAEFLRNEETHL